MYLKYNDLVLRRAEKKDAGQLTAWWNDGSVMAHAGFPNGLGISEQETAAKIDQESDESIQRLIIELSGQPVGEMCCRNMGDHTADIGIKICDASQQEHGYGKILLCMLIKELFAEGYTKIQLDTDFGNKRAQHVYEKIGFQKVSINEHSWIDQLGNDRSSVSYLMHQDDLIDYAK